MPIFYFLKSMFLQSKLASFLSRRSQKTLYRTIFLKNYTGTKFQIFKFSTFLNPCFVVLNGQISIYKITKHFILDYFAKKQEGVNFQFFIKTSGLTPLQKCQISDFLKSTFFWFKMDSFLARTSQNTFFRTIQVKKGKNVRIFDQKSGKKKEKSFLIFDQKSWTKPTKKMQIIRLFKSIF